MAYATVGENTLYVQGGVIDANLTSTNQLFSLDLTRPWNVSSPPWKSLSIGSGSRRAPFDTTHSMTVSKDQQTLLILGMETVDSSLNISTYNITDNSWSAPKLGLVSNVTQGLNGLAAVADPNSGLIYIPGGGNEGQNMLEYDPSSGSSRLLAMPAEYVGKVVRFFTAVWSTQRNSIILYGGFYNASGVDIAFSTLYEYQPSAATWSIITTSGDAPDASTSHCMVPAYNGAKMALFGGILYSNPQRSLYILDVQSMKWTRGTDIDPPLARFRMACSAAGDSFVAWGGFGGAHGEASANLLGTPVVYDLKANRWVSQFAPVSTSPPSDPINPSSGLRSSTTAIGNFVAAATVAIIIGYFS
ncbi:hypothetical protein BGX27_004090 [Mortierella sp. AM989]|nr:hypothetical protein BGX27_004090 [Mortierella sp. AM989]